jgi:hypothetical protein
MTALTTPAIFLGLLAVGLAARCRHLIPAWITRRLGGAPEQLDPLRADVLWFGSMLAPLVVIALPGTPIFGGTKHWLTAYPFLALFAGAGFSTVLRSLKRAVTDMTVVRARARRWLAPILVPLLGTIVFASPLLDCIDARGLGLSYYGFTAGGVPGAADLGMNRQFWGFSHGRLAAWLEAQLPDGGRVYICDATPKAWAMQHLDGTLRENVRPTLDIGAADLAIVHHEHHFVEVDYQIWQAYGTVTPAFVLTYDGVPIVSVYENPERRRRSVSPGGRAPPRTR